MAEQTLAKFKKHFFHPHLRWLRVLRLDKPAQVALLFFICLILLLGIFFVGLEVSANMKLAQLTQGQYKSTASEIVRWEGIVRKYPNYRDGYFHLSILEYQLGDMMRARTYLEKALEIDPNFELGRKLEKTLGVR